MKEDMTEILREYFRDREEVLLCFLFGSAVNGRLTAESDVDIAVLFDSLPDFSDLSEMTEAASEALGKDVEIVVMNGSSPIIRMQVLRNGRLLKGLDSAAYRQFFVQTIKEYDDLKYIRKEAEENILRGRIYA